MESFKKEIIFALVFGVIVGLTAVVWATGSYKNLPNTLTKMLKPSSISPALVSPTPAPSGNKILLTVSSPVNEETVATNSAKITGQGKKNSKILIISEKGESILTTDNKGNFSYMIDLNLGSNQIKLTTLPVDEENYKDLTIFYFPND